MQYKIPTWDNGTWTYTIFSDREDFRIFIKRLFKEPGLYNLDKTTHIWNEQARTFNKNRMFCDAPEGSRDYLDYWDTEKEKCRKGIIYKNVKGTTWYLSRTYYHWLNFLQIGGKEEGAKFQFPYIWDTQYHIMLYEFLAELSGKNSVILKKRQIASSYLHTAKIYNKYLFEESYVAKVMASKKSYIDAVNGCWKMFNEYHNFNNTHTAWACNNDPEKQFSWQQKVETKTLDGRKIRVGTQAVIIGITLDKDPVAGVGGRVHDVFYEEGGVAPTADVTYIYMKPALKQGSIVTGMFTIAGSVGELDQCEPLKKFIMEPEGNGFLGIDTNLIDADGTTDIAGLFIPEQWSYPPFIDKFGNSKVTEALDYINSFYEDCRIGNIEKGIKAMSPEDYQTLVSQGPRNIKEAFAIRTVSVFPIKHTARQIKRIEDGNYYLKYVDLERTAENTIEAKKSEREPCPFPMSMSAPDKRGCIVIHQHPGKGSEWGSYYFSVDPIEVGRSDTSESLASVYIYMNPIEVTQIDEEGNSKTFIEGDKLVAEWVGRYDDPNDTNENISLLVEYYNAWGISENNKTSFNNYMMLKKRSKHLAPADQMLFDKELGISQNVYQKFGWSKSGTNETGIWKKILGYGINFLSEELGNEVDKDGKITKVRYGVERIPFVWLLKEMQNYQSKGNFDRIIAFCALIAFARIQQAAGVIKKRVERKEQTPKQNLHTFEKTSFLKSIGKRGGPVRRMGIGFKSIGR